MRNARLYEVPVKPLNELVRRNAKRFPENFMFQLSEEEAVCLRSQFTTLDTLSRANLSDLGFKSLTRRLQVPYVLRP